VLVCPGFFWSPNHLLIFTPPPSRHLAFTVNGCSLQSPPVCVPSVSHQPCALSPAIRSALNTCLWSAPPCFCFFSALGILICSLTIAVSHPFFPHLVMRAPATQVILRSSIPAFFLVCGFAFFFLLSLGCAWNSPFWLGRQLRPPMRSSVVSLGPVLFCATDFSTLADFDMPYLSRSLVCLKSPVGARCSSCDSNGHCFFFPLRSA